MIHGMTGMLRRIGLRYALINMDGGSMFGLEVSCPFCNTMLKMEMEEDKGSATMAAIVASELMGELPSISSYHFSGSEECPICSRNIHAVLTVGAMDAV